MTSDPAILTREDFGHRLQDAYRHLYDLTYLRTHPLLDYLVPAAVVSRKERAWQLHRLLIEVIDELDPGLDSPQVTPEWRRHQLLVLRYQEGQGPQEIADALAISRRHFYRDHDAALAAIAELLWARQMQPAPAANRMELLRRETAALWQEEQGASLEQIIEALQGLFADVAHQNRVYFVPFVAPHLPRIALEPSLLRHLLIGMMGFLMQETTATTVRFAAEEVAPDRVQLSIILEGATSVPWSADPAHSERFGAVTELAALNHVEIDRLDTPTGLVELRLRLPASQRPTILVVDDNADTLLLFERLLTPNNYKVVLAQSGEEAVRRARQVAPEAIVLDLMMPRQDGWDLLQYFRGEDATRTMPVIVCSILRQRELALAFGANAFLEKPINEEHLLTTLAMLVRSR